MLFTFACLVVFRRLFDLAAPLACAAAAPEAWLLSEAPAPDLEADGIVALPMQLHGDRAHVMSLTSRYPGEPRRHVRGRRAWGKRLHPESHAGEIGRTTRLHRFSRCPV